MMPFSPRGDLMDNAAHVVAMGSKGIAMTGVFLVVILALLIGGLFTYVQARKRNSGGNGGVGG
jgi:hypothetical protein